MGAENKEKEGKMVHTELSEKNRKQKEL